MFMFKAEISVSKQQISIVNCEFAIVLCTLLPNLILCGACACMGMDTYKGVCGMCVRDGIEI